MVTICHCAADVEPYDKIYLRAKLRIMTKKDSNHVEKQGKLYWKHDLIICSPELNCPFVQILLTVESWSDRANSWGSRSSWRFLMLRIL